MALKTQSTHFVPLNVIYVPMVCPISSPDASSSGMVLVLPKLPLRLKRNKVTSCWASAHMKATIQMIGTSFVLTWEGHANKGEAWHRLSCGTWSCFLYFGPQERFLVADRHNQILPRWRCCSLWPVGMRCSHHTEK